MQVNNKLLAAIFFTLLAIWIVRKTACKPTQCSFRSHITVIDTSSVDRILLWPKGENGEQITLTKNPAWMVSDGSKTVKADPSRVNSILGQLVNIPVKQLISKNPDRQKDYEVDMASGKIVEIYSNDQLIDKLIVGRFNFNQQTRSGVSYARKDGEDDIYSVDGFISMSFDTDFNSFRPRQLLQLQSQDLKSIRLTALGQSTTIQKGIDQNWDMNGLSLDSTAMAQYASSITNISGSSFYDGTAPSSAADYSISYQGDNMIGGITIDAWNNTDSSDPFILRSSQNDAFFTSDSTGIFNQIFEKLIELTSS